MEFTIAEIKEKLTYSLPGDKAHLEMSPMGRSELSKALKISHQYRLSAVALILATFQHQMNLVLIQRRSYNGFHSGEISFPGGKKEEYDTTLLKTSLRESFEETGLDKNNFNLLGKLSTVYIPVSKFSVEPYVFQYNEPLNFTPSKREVAEIFSFPISRLFENDAIKKTKLVLNNGMTLNNVPYFDINNKIVWGATALILNELRWVLK